MHTENIQKIVDSGDSKKMHELRDVLVNLIDDLKTQDYYRYVQYEHWIHSILYGEHLGKDLAECWVSKMKNKDGTTGQHWTYEQVSQVMREKGMKCDTSDFYAVLNMVYSDYYNSKFDLNTYIELAKDWLNDEDVKDKVVKYYYYVVK